MQYAVVVQGLEPQTDLADHLEGLAGGEPLVLEPVSQRALVGVRHDEVGPAVLELARVVDGHDVR